MNKRKNSKSKKLRIIKIISFIFIGVGLLFLLYPSFTNIIAEIKKVNVLSEWEAQKETFLEEEITSKDILEEDNKKGNEIIEESDGSSIGTDNNIDEEIVDYKDLTAEDFFPLKIRIPKIDLEWIVNEGTDRQTLKEGPGHIIETPLPGDLGRCTFSGHRTTYGAPFNKIDELVKGDLIYLETIKGEVLTYVVTGLEIIDPRDVYILEGSDKKELLLTSCYPEYSAAERVILTAELVNIYDIGVLLNE